jgi:DNA repair exonuclease SbcCD ATPase subunit
MELDLLDLDNENQRLQKSLEMTTKRLNQLEKDNTDLEVENEKLQKSMEEMKMSSKRLVDVEKESSELENEISKLQNSKAVLEKEIIVIYSLCIKLTRICKGINLLVS